MRAHVAGHHQAAGDIDPRRFAARIADAVAFDNQIARLDAPGERVDDQPSR
jgi:hypothetical protein